MRYVEYQDGIVFGPRLHWSHVDLHGFTLRPRYLIVGAGFITPKGVKYGESIGLQIKSTPGSCKEMIKDSWCGLVSQMGYDTAIFTNNPEILKYTVQKDCLIKRFVKSIQPFENLPPCHPNRDISEDAWFTSW